MLRPEKLKVVDQADGAGLNVFAGQVKELVYQGESSLLYVSLPGGEPIAVRHPAGSTERALPPLGAPITLGLAPGDTIIVPADEALTPWQWLQSQCKPAARSAAQARNAAELRAQERNEQWMLGSLAATGAAAHRASWRWRRSPGCSGCRSAMPSGFTLRALRAARSSLLSA